MKTSQAGLNLIDSFEDDRLEAYPDPKTGGAPWSIGRGATGDGIGPGTIWTQAQSDARFAVDITLREAVIGKVVTVPLTQGQFDAMVSILYNVGYGSSEKDGIIVLKSGQPSTLLRKLNAGDYAGSGAEFPKWCSPGTNVTAGLLRRRLAERAMFLASTEVAIPDSWGGEGRP